jgi:hypothetical protein
MSGQSISDSACRNDSFSHLEILQNFPDTILKQSLALLLVSLRMPSILARILHKRLRQLIDGCSL